MEAEWQVFDFQEGVLSFDFQDNLLVVGLTNCEMQIYKEKGNVLV